MSITYQSKIEDGILVITTSGKDDNENQVIEYGRSIIRLIVDSDINQVLCDERNLEYAIGTFEIFEVAKQIAEEAPKTSSVAIVCKQEFLTDGKFWETVAVNRGLQVHLGTDFNQAKDWLVKRMG